MGKRASVLWCLLALAGAIVSGCTAGTGEGATEPAGAEEGSDRPEPTAPGGTLGDVRERGALRCGVDDTLPGFGFPAPGGRLEGFDADVCRLVAAAVLGDADAAEFVPVTGSRAWSALRGGDVDLLASGTTWTASGDGVRRGAFVTTTFHDAHSVMVPGAGEVARLDDLEGAPVCVVGGTATEHELEAHAAAGGPTVDLVALDGPDEVGEALRDGRCEGWAGRRSLLAVHRSRWEAGADDLRILEDPFARAPLAPVTLEGDSQWHDAVNWAVLAAIRAEELDIDSGNVERMTASDDPEVRRLLGQPDAGGDPDTVFDPGLGLDPRYVVEVVGQVGNYREVYERNLGPDTPIGLERGPNTLWSRGGLLYAPPYR